MAGKRTIEDIARLAGVSKATVSRVLNNKPDVDPTTRGRIMRIVEEEGFVPSITASGLAVGRTRLIGILIPSLSWPFIASVIQGVADAMDHSPYEMVLYSMKEATQEQERTRIIDNILATRLTSGLLAIFPGSSSVTLPHYIALQQSHKFPIVLIDDHEKFVDVPYITADNYTGAIQGVSYLIQLGHRRIACIKGPQDVYSARERYRGYCDALKNADIEIDDILVRNGNYQTETGRVCANELFSLPPEKQPTAIFAANDMSAYGVLRAAEEHDLKIPQDISLIGFDDIPASLHMRPALTTVKQPFYEMGQRGVEMLLSLMQHSYSPVPGNGTHVSLHTNNPAYRTDHSLESSEDTTTTQAVYTGDALHVQLPTSLIVRASSGSPRHLPVSPSLPS